MRQNMSDSRDLKPFLPLEALSLQLCLWTSPSFGRSQIGEAKTQTHTHKRCKWLCSQLTWQGEIKRSYNWWTNTRALFQYEDSLSRYEDSHVKDRQLWDCLIFNRDPYTGKMASSVDTAPRDSWSSEGTSLARVLSDNLRAQHESLSLGIDYISSMIHKISQISKHWHRKEMLKWPLWTSETLFKCDYDITWVLIVKSSLNAWSDANLRCQLNPHIVETVGCHFVSQGSMLGSLALWGTSKSNGALKKF